ncbi:Uncharacterised protein [Serratia quinivorans]|nr:Uncharacterised protein [Serratia quinivorans]
MIRKMLRHENETHYLPCNVLYVEYFYGRDNLVLIVCPNHYLNRPGFYRHFFAS